MKAVILFSVLFFYQLAAGQIAVNNSGTAPHASAMLDVQSTSKGMLIPRMTTAQRTAIAPVKGLLVFDNTTSSFWFYNGTSWTELAESGSDAKWFANGTHITNSNFGSVGIGITSPSEKLDVNGNIRSRGRVDADGVIEGKGISSLGAFYVSGTSLFGGNISAPAATFSGTLTSNTGVTINDPAGTLQLQNGGTNKGFVQLSGDDLRLGTNSGNSLGNVIVRMNGANRFQFAESGRLSLLADQTPTLYFNTGGVNRAYLQLQGENIKIDAPGNKVNIGDDMTVDDATSRVGIGTATPEQKLHVTGNIKTNTGKLLNAEDINLVPIAMAYFDENANKVRGTSNISAYRRTVNSSFRCFVVTVSGVTDLSNAIFHVTGIGAQSWGSVGGISGNTVNILIYENIIDEETTWRPFYITIYN